MPQIKPQYDQLEEYTEIAEKLIGMYPQVFDGIDIRYIKPLAITNKNRTEKNKNYWTIKAVPSPINIDCSHVYYITFHASDWEGMGDAQRAILVAQSLFSIPRDGEDREGKVNTFDFKDFATMVFTFGPGYLEKNDLPDITKTKINWVDPLELL